MLPVKLIAACDEKKMTSLLCENFLQWTSPLVSHLLTLSYPSRPHLYLSVPCSFLLLNISFFSSSVSTWLISFLSACISPRHAFIAACLSAVNKFLLSTYKLAGLKSAGWQHRLATIPPSSQNLTSPSISMCLRFLICKTGIMVYSWIINENSPSLM